MRGDRKREEKERVDRKGGKGEEEGETQGDRRERERKDIDRERYIFLPNSWSSDRISFSCSYKQKQRQREKLIHLSEIKLIEG